MVVVTVVADDVEDVATTGAASSGAGHVDMIESEMLDDRTLMDRSGSVVSGSGADIVCTTKRDNLRTC